MGENDGRGKLPFEWLLPQPSAALRETAADTFPRWGKDKEAAAGDRKGEAKRRAPLRGNVVLRRRGWRPRQPAVRLALLRPLPSSASRGKAAATVPPCGARKTLRAFADPCVFRPLRNFRLRFICHWQREAGIPPEGEARVGRRGRRPLRVLWEDRYDRDHRRRCGHRGRRRYRGRGRIAASASGAARGNRIFGKETAADGAVFPYPLLPRYPL